MFSEKMAQVISHLIGAALFITLYFVAKQQQRLPEKKVFGFPLSKISAALAIYFFAMAVFAYFNINF